MDRTLEIKITGDNAPFRRAIDGVIKESKRGTDGQASEFKRAGNAHRQLADQLAKNAKSWTDLQIKEGKRATDEQVKEFKRVAAENISTKRTSTNEIIKDVQRGSAATKQAYKEEEVSARSAYASMARESKRMSDAQIRSDKERSASTLQAFRGQSSGLADVRARLDANRKAATNTGGAFGRMADTGIAGMLKFATATTAVGFALNQVRDIAHGVGSAIIAAAERSRQLAGDFTKSATDARGLAAVLGVAPDDTFALQNANFNAVTGFSQAEGLQFRSQYANSGNQFKGNKISEPEFYQAEQQLGALGMARGLPGDVAGDLAGSALGFRDYTKFGDRASETALGDVNQALAVLDAGKGEPGVLGRQLSMTAAASLSEDGMRGQFRTLAEAATAVSVAAERNPAGANEVVRAGIRAVADLNDKNAGPLLAEAKITEKDTFFEKMKKLSPVVNEQAKSRGVKTDTILSEAFHNELEREAISVFLNRGVEGGVITQREGVAKANVGEAPAVEAVRRFQSTTGGQRALADADVALSETKQGQKNSRLDIIRRQEIRKMIDSGELDSAEGNIKDFLREKVTFGMIDSGRQQRITDHVRTRINDQAVPLGIPEAKDMGAWNAAADRSMNNRLDQLKAKGVDGTIDTKRMEQLMEENNELQKKILAGQGRGNKVPEALPGGGRPAGDPRRP
jgi:hypothetical protein